MDDLLNEFLSETTDMIAEVSTAVTLWEDNLDNRTQFDKIFRFFHTIKGSSAFLNLPRLTALAHASETLLDSRRHHISRAEPAVAKAILSVIDCMALICEGTYETGREPSGGDKALIRHLYELSTTPTQTTLSQNIEATAQAATPSEESVADSAEADSADVDTIAPSEEGSRKAQDSETQDSEAKDSASADVRYSDTIATSEGANSEIAGSAPPALSSSSVASLPVASYEEAELSYAQRSIRVSLPLVDSIMNDVVEMLRVRNDLARLVNDRAPDAKLSEVVGRLSETISDLRYSICRIRMQPIGRLFAPLPRLVRDQARAMGKQVKLSVSGGEIELDREILETIRDPLVHIIRNALVHGLAVPQARLEVGKNSCGHIHIGAYQHGNYIDIVVRDDGCGIAMDKLVDKALAMGMVTPKDIAAMDMREQASLIFARGLSTASAVTESAGRGVGMDVVKSNIEKIGGSVEVDSRAGEGVSIRLRVPMTLTIISGLLVSAGGQAFAIAGDSIEEILLENNPAVEFGYSDSCHYVRVRGELMSLIRLEDIIHAPIADDTMERTLLIVRSSLGHCYGLSVAVAYDYADMVVRPAAPLLLESGLYEGTTLPDHGHPILWLDTTAIPCVVGVDLVATHSPEEATPAEPAPLTTQNQIILFRDTASQLCALPLAFLERIDEFPLADIIYQAGHSYIHIGDRLLSVYDMEQAVQGADKLDSKVKMMLLKRGDSSLFYPIESVVDIIRTPDTIQPCKEQGLLAGTMRIGSDVARLFDGAWLLNQATAPADNDHLLEARPLCRVLAEEDEAWVHSFLAPILETAGYRVAIGEDNISEEVGDVFLVTEPCGDSSLPDALSSESQADGRSDKPTLIRLRPTPAARDADDESIYCYDRAGLITALVARLRS